MLNEEQILNIAKTVMSMDSQPGKDLDSYYPTCEELDSLGKVVNGLREYSTYDIAFLIWVQQPIDPMALTAEQQKVNEYAVKLLADYINRRPVEDPENEYKHLADICKQHGYIVKADF